MRLRSVASFNEEKSAIIMKANLPVNEELRLNELYDFHILDTPPDEDFDNLVRLASKLCNTPISTISLIDAHRQWFKAKIGIEDSENSRDISFCAHAINQQEIFVVKDARQDERFFDNPLVTGNPEIRFYAGVPLVTNRGNRLGTLCVIDCIPRNITDDEREILATLGKQVVKLMELHKSNYELQQISKQENSQRIQLEEANKMQQKIISVIAHDVRSPLHNVKSLLQLIPEKQTVPPQIGMYMDMGISQLNNTVGLLDNLVEWGKLQMHTEECASKNCNLHDIANDVLKDLQIPAGLKKIYLKNRIDTKLEIVSDENIIKFILRNLVTNAIKFTKEGGITLSAVASSGSIGIKVTDTGIGMSQAILELLFCGQKKISRKGTQNEAGSGLGLSLVKGFIEKLHGSIEAKSEVGKGTSISFSLPVTISNKEVEPAQNSIHKSGKKHSKFHSFFH
jgi:signal transduction histidine kinase